MQLRSCLVLFILALLLTVSAAHAAALPSPWSTKGDAVDKYDTGIDPSVVRDGKPSVFIRSRVDKVGGFATVREKISAEKYVGKRVQFSAWLKTQKVDDGALLWLRVDGDDKPLAFDNMADRPVRGTTDWQQCACVVDVPPGAKAILFGIWLSETGQVWANGLQFKVVGHDVPVTDLLAKQENLPTEPVNLDFTENK